MLHRISSTHGPAEVPLRARAGAIPGRLLPLVAILWAATTGAESIQITGASGASGVRGASVPFPMDGTDGLAGASAEASATALGEANEAIAVGGSGGRGGDGGSIISPGDRGGDGGNGADGGDATATARSLGGRTTRAVANGGWGGAAGSGGSYWLPEQGGLQGERGGRGGDANALAVGEHDFSGTTPPTQGLRVEARANGGQGGSGRVLSGSGGAATAVASGAATGSGGSNVLHEVIAEAFGAGGQLLADDGDTRAEAIGRAAFGQLSVLANAIGRDFNDFVTSATGEGADANAIAFGTHTGAGRLLVEAFARVGTVGDRSGTGSAQAEGIATSGADVEVLAELESAGSIDLHDAVSGSTAGLLYLRQRISARNIDISDRSGDVVSSLDATNPGGGDLRIEMRAFGGDPAVAGEIGGDATIESSSGTAAGDVDIDAWAISGAQGRAAIELLRGISTGGGDVSVAGRVGSSAAVDLRVENVVDGETTGALELSQQVEGSRIDPGPGGARPLAESVLSRSKDLDQLTLFNDASGVLARTHTSGENAGGNLHVQGRATGYASAAEMIAGGEAVSHARGVTHGDGHDIQIGRGLVQGGQTAVGGVGFRSFGSPRTSDGGRADSFSEGIALGDSAVSVFDFAKGGDAGSVVGTLGNQIGARGGDASSRGFASNAGGSDVLVESLAEGGVGGRGYGAGNRSGEGGAATASARGESSGGADVVLRVTARGGLGGQAGSSNELAGKGGDATVTDVSGSTSGTLRIEARASAGWGGRQIDGAQRGGSESGVARLDLDVENEGGGALELIGFTGTLDGGLVVIDSMRGRSSTGADVTVDLSFGSNGSNLAGAPTGAADPIRIENLVQGETSGVLRLRQAFSGGNPQAALSNVLRREGHHRGLSLETQTYSRGSGDGVSIADASNHAGWSEARAFSAAVGRVADAIGFAQGVGEETTRANAVSSLEYSAEMTGDARARGIAIAVSDGGGGAMAQASASSPFRSAAVSALANAHEVGAGAVRAAVQSASGVVDRIDAWAFTRGADWDATRGDGPQSGPFAQSYAVISSAPTTAQVEAARERHPALDDHMAASPSTVHSVGRWAAENDANEAYAQRVELDIVLEPTGAPRDVLLAVFEQSSRGGGFESLRFWLEVNGDDVGEEQVFDSLDAANSYFARLIGLEGIVPRPVAPLEPGVDLATPTIRAIFETSTRQYQSAVFGLAVVVVPEPGTGVLMLFGLAVLGVRRRRPSAGLE